MTQASTQQNSKVHTGDSPTFWLKPEQIDAIRSETVANSAHYLADRNDAIHALLADTGLRVAELAALDEGMVDFEDSALRIPARIQKGYIEESERPSDKPYSGPSPVGIALAADTLRTLRKYLNGSWYSGKDTDALFPARSSDRISTQGIRNLVSKDAESAEVRPHSTQGRGDSEDVSPHSYRHSVAYRMVTREGKTLTDVKNRLRHSSLDTTEAYYSHFDMV